MTFSPTPAPFVCARTFCLLLALWLCQTRTLVAQTPNGVVVAGGNGTGQAANQLFYPSGAHVDGSGTVYVADEFNDRISKWVPGATQGVTVAGGNGEGSAANQLRNPVGVYVDGSGNVYVTDRDNSRVMKFPPLTSSCTTMISVRTGNWSDPGTWSCNRIPTTTDAVEIRHRVALYDGYTGNARQIRYATGGTLRYGIGAKLRLGN